MAGLDIICIGAVNYDYMFRCSAEDLLTDTSEGAEDLSNSTELVEKDIRELVRKDRSYTTQLGGSAFITLKVIKYIYGELKAAYVGVCGILSDFELRFGKTNDLESELDHLDSRDWFFTTENRFDLPENRYIAKSVVRLYNHSRNCIRIAPNANNTLLERIREKEYSGEESLADYLAQARWVHLSSLSDFDQFEEIMTSVRTAKRKNPGLFVSMDPGFEYTLRYRNRLQKLIGCVDYMFLNNSEKKNLGGNVRDIRALYRNIREYCTLSGVRKGPVLVVKHDNRTEFVRFENGKTGIKTVWHRKMYNYEMHNDTGAGDSFAGGFIAGMLDRMDEPDIPWAAGMGVVAAKGRMRSFDHENPYYNIHSDAGKYIRGEKMRR